MLKNENKRFALILNVNFLIMKNLVGTTIVPIVEIE